MRLTVGFSGSGGTGKTPLLTKTFAGSRRIPASGEAAVRCKRCWLALRPTRTFAFEKTMLALVV